MNGIPSWARKGVKCVYIGPGFAWAETAPLWKRLTSRFSRDPRRDDICQIARVRVDADGVWLRLRGYNPVAWYEIKSFRPLVEPKTEAQDVALFTSHLKQGLRVPTTVGERDDA